MSLFRRFFLKRVVWDFSLDCLTIAELNILHTKVARAMNEKIDRFRENNKLPDDWDSGNRDYDKNWDDE